MNCLTVIQASQGIAQHILDTNPGRNSTRVVIGYDGRYDSKRFAELAATAFLGYGIGVIWYDEVVHTPLVPFGVKSRGAIAGIMITASHNPKEYNGLKLYGSNGCQINTPEDTAVAQSIMRNLEPRSWKTSKLKSERASIMKDYFETINQIGDVKSFPRFVYTPLHGVGLPYLCGALDTILGSTGKSNQDVLEVVPSQAIPDPAFPTVLYPNPEEDGALDLAKIHADKHDLDLIIANDPVRDH